jgi:hypothetical protein
VALFVSTALMAEERECIYINAYASFCDINWEHVIGKRDIVIYAEFDQDAIKWIEYIDEIGVSPKRINIDISGKMANKKGLEIPEIYELLYINDDSWKKMVIETNSILSPNVYAESNVTICDIEIDSIKVCEEYDFSRYNESNINTAKVSLSDEDRYLYFGDVLLKDEDRHRKPCLVKYDKKQGKYQLIGKPATQGIGGYEAISDIWIDGDSLILFDNKLDRITRFSISSDEVLLSSCIDYELNCIWNGTSRNGKYLLSPCPITTYEETKYRLVFGKQNGDCVEVKSVCCYDDDLRNSFIEWGHIDGNELDEMQSLTREIAKTNGIWKEMIIASAGEEFFAVDAYGKTIYVIEIEDDQIVVKNKMMFNDLECRSFEPIKLVREDDVSPKDRFCRIRRIFVSNDYIFLYMHKSIYCRIKNSIDGEIWILDRDNLKLNAKLYTKMMVPVSTGDNDDIVFITKIDEDYVLKVKLKFKLK